ncbi:hypothetical protein PC115_g435 [Phytophthora cactorum]|uniref:Tc1-like transposase DDE domain-containing protein n=1 Tax=Phytophthora cactorum TaxID=29920 RepID=A0A8T1DUN9_9STRA|nr:hypothetical protein PC115_g435 [Phytophthora cactorum]
MSRATAYRLCKAGDPSLPARGGARASVVKCTDEIVKAMEGYLDAECMLTLTQLADKVQEEFGVELSTSTISAKLATKLITLKQFVEHQAKGDYIVYYDETNYNLFCMHSQGRAAKGKRAVVKTTPPKGKTCKFNAQFHIYEAVKNSETYRNFYGGKSVVTVLDNAPAHNQTETRLVEELGEHSDLVLLRLGPYSPMLNPIEGCFSVFKAKVKAFLAAHRQRMFDQGAFLSLTEARMTLLEDAANSSIRCINRHLVTSMALHCQRALADALKMEDIQYGT